MISFKPQNNSLSAAMIPFIVPALHWGVLHSWVGREQRELTVGERSLWDSRASLSRRSCSTSSWAWVIAGFSQCCTSRPAPCSRASRAAPFTWLTWHREKGSIKATAGPAFVR